MAGRGYKTEAVVLRSFRFGEADRVLHLYTLERGRVGAVAKGIRRTKSRFGARLEPLSHAELLLHQGSGELATVTGAELVRAHRDAREDPYRCARTSSALVPAEAALALGLPAAPDELRGVRGRRPARRLLAAGGRGRLRALRRGLAAALARGDPRHRGSAGAPARRGRDRPPRGAGGAAGDHRVVRVPRRLPPADTRRPLSHSLVA